MTSALDVAIALIGQGVAPVPVAYRGKAPTDPQTGRPMAKWQNLRITAGEASRYFPGGPQNIGALLGEPSGGLVDVDLDCPEAIRAAPHLLPPTRRQGRAGAPDSHWMYIAPGSVTRPLRDPVATERRRSTLVEIRSTGAQTVVAGSVHESGETIVWSNPEEPFARVDAGELLLAVHQLAAAALLGRYWPSEGLQGEAASALSGALRYDGLEPERAARLVRAVLAAARSEDTQHDGDGEADGWEPFWALLSTQGQRAASVARGWLAVHAPARASERHPQSVSGPRREPEKAEATDRSVADAPDNEPLEVRFIPPAVRRRRAERWLSSVTREAHGDGSLQLVRVAATLTRGFALGETLAYELLSKSQLARGWSSADLRRRCVDAMRGPHGGEPMPWGCKLLPAARHGEHSLPDGSLSDVPILDGALEVQAPAPAPLFAEHTDVANAHALVTLFGSDLRFVGAWGKGIVWDDGRWVLDDGTRWHYSAVKTAETMYGRARGALDEAVGGVDKGRLDAARRDLDWAVASHSAGRVTAMANISRTLPEVSISHDSLDADQCLLNLQNGTVDLRTGELRPHRREDLITRIAPVAYEPFAKAPTWEAFLHRVMGGDRALVAYLQRLIGYALTAEVREHVLVFFYGGGANGKSTFLSTIHAMLGDYATPAPRGLLFRARGERHPTELATLFGRRFVTCSEIEEGQVFDEALTKDLTGGDRIECRRMREDFWTFEPTHKLFLAGNHKPTVRGDDEGIWRRMRLVPWTVTIPPCERDTRLPEKLRAELPGILRWAIDGCMAWQREGLGAPPAVRQATDDYREENDSLGEFFRLHVVFEQGAAIVRRDLREAYEAWCKENGQPPFAARRFAARLRERGVVDTCVRRGLKPLDGWRNVRLMTDVEKEQRMVAREPAAPAAHEALFVDDLAELGIN
jgi:P4 family phage/plasmid primase-like protien